MARSGDTALVERRALVRSIVVTAALGAIGIVWGVLSGSQMILLDGVYSYVGIVLSVLMLRASRLSDTGPTRSYPYGREAATPLVIGIQGFVLLAALLYAAVEALAVIADGGADITPGWAIVYGVLTAVGSLIVWIVLRRDAHRSDLVRSEAAAWMVATLRGAGMIVGFGAMWILIDSGSDTAARYVDPAMVLITVAVSLSTPVRMIRAGVLELLEATPNEELGRDVDGRARAVAERHGLIDPVLRVSKLGPKLYVELDASVDPATTVAWEHTVRNELQDSLDGLPYEVWLNVDLFPLAAVEVSESSSDGHG